MPKFSNTKVKPRSAIKTVASKSTLAQPTTYEGRPGYERDAKSELFMLAIRNMVGEDTFYEPAAERDNRFRNLVHTVAVDDAEWIARFIPYLRDTMNMRSAAVVMAAEAVFALLGKPNKDVNLRKIIDSAIVRADEPAELLAYWKAQKGAVPKPVKRGISDAVRRLYNERNALKYDGQSRGFRMADVIDIVHPEPEGETQSRLFRWLLDRRHNRENITVEGLPIVEQWNELQAVPQSERRAYLKNGPAVFREAGFTWEMLSGWLGGAMDAEAWETIIPSMGYMALLRNLRNFEKAGVSNETVQKVIGILTDPENVAKSRQFPFRFYSAYKNTESMLWAQALETALEHSVQNIPALSGKTLVMVDLSGSMGSPLSAKSKVLNYEVGALFGAALAKRAGAEVTLVGFGTNSAEFRVPKATSVLKLTETVTSRQRVGDLGYGTETFPAIKKHYNGHNRIVIFTDQQSFGTAEERNRLTPYQRIGWGTLGGGTADEHKFVDQLPIPIYNFDLGGYKVAQFETGKDNRYEFGGFSDQAFKMLDLLEKHRDTGWPF